MLRLTVLFCAVCCIFGTNVRSMEVDGNNLMQKLATFKRLLDQEDTLFKKSMNTFEKLIPIRNTNNRAVQRSLLKASQVVLKNSDDRKAERARIIDERDNILETSNYIKNLNHQASNTYFLSNQLGPLLDEIISRTKRLLDSTKQLSDLVNYMEKELNNV